MFASNISVIVVQPLNATSRPTKPSGREIRIVLMPRKRDTRRRFVDEQCSGRFAAMWLENPLFVRQSCQTSEVFTWREEGACLTINKVAGGRIELPTRGFSVLCSAN